MTENLKASSEKEYKKTVQLINNCLNIYNDIEEKNYSAMLHESLKVIGQIMPERNLYSNLLIKTWKLNNEGNQGSFAEISEYLDKIDGIIAQQADKRNRARDSTCLYKLVDAIYSRETGKNLLVYNQAKECKNKTIQLYNRATTSPTSVQRHNTFLYSLARLGEFLTEVEKASDGKSLSDVLAAYTVQPNSYLIKRNTRASISIQSYVGTYFGNEYAPSSKPVFGLSAPIGISFNWGFHNKNKPNQITDATFIGRDGGEKTLSGSSFSINLSVIDIGAVVSYRINNGEDGPLPKNVTFGQFLSPGLSFSYGIKNIPLSLTIGTQFTPQLRNLSRESQQHSAIRIYGGLFYDLPFQSFSQR